MSRPTPPPGEEGDAASRPASESEAAGEPGLPVPPALPETALPPTQTGPTVPPTQAGPTVPPAQAGPTVPPTQTGPNVPPTQTGPTVPPTHPGTTVPPTSAPYSTRSVTEMLADRLDNEGFFTALFDMTFTKFVTRKLAGPVYIVGLTLIALGFVLAFISSIGAAVGTGSVWGVFLFLLDLLLSVVSAMLAVLLLRVGIEVFVAVVAIAENTRPRGRRDSH